MDEAMTRQFIAAVSSITKRLIYNRCEWYWRVVMSWRHDNRINPAHTSWMAVYRLSLRIAWYGALDRLERFECWNVMSFMNILPPTAAPARPRHDDFIHLSVSRHNRKCPEMRVILASSLTWHIAETRMPEWSSSRRNCRRVCRQLFRKKWWRNLSIGEINGTAIIKLAKYRQ